MSGDDQRYDATSDVHRQIEGMKGSGKCCRVLAHRRHVPSRVSGDWGLHEWDVHQASQNAAEDGQGGSPVAEADHLEGGPGEMQKEEDEDQGQG